MKAKSALTAITMAVAMVAAPGLTMADDHAGASVEVAAEAETGFWGRLFGRSGRDSDSAGEREQAAKEKAEKSEKQQKAKHKAVAADAQAEHAAEAEQHRADPASKGQKKGWKDGVPPGQAKKGDAKAHAKAKGQAGHGGDHQHQAESEAAAEAEAEVTVEGALRKAAKDKAVRASGAAAGSVEEELIRVGTDVLIDGAVQQ